MPRPAKLVALLMLAMLIASPMMALAAPVVADAPPAHCDDHPGTAPAVPSGYACCQGGHNFAVLQETFSLQPLINCVSFDHTPLLTTSRQTFVFIPDVSDSPPPSVPLRI